MKLHQAACCILMLCILTSNVDARLLKNLLRPRTLLGAGLATYGASRLLGNRRFGGYSYGYGHQYGYPGHQYGYHGHQYGYPSHGYPPQYGYPQQIGGYHGYSGHYGHGGTDFLGIASVGLGAALALS